VVTAPTVVVVTPSEALLAPCPNPYRASKTTGDMADQLTLTREALKICSAQVDGIRRWRDENRSPGGAP